MGYVIIDLEFNNLQNINKYYTNFYEDYKEFKSPEIQNEIIEIGAIKVDKYLKVEDELKFFIKPSFFPFLNPEISKMTNIEDTDLENGVSFKEGMDKLKEFLGDYTLCSWAKDDIAVIIINSHYHKYNDLKWIDKYIDLQEYASNVLGVKKSVGLKNALEILRIDYKKDELHDALNDSIYTLKVLKRIYNFRILEKYKIKDIYNMPAINIKNLSDFTLDDEKVKSLCPKCKEKINLFSDYIPLRWRFFSVGHCSKCDNKILNEVILKKTLVGEIVYKEVGSFLNEYEYSNYTYKLEKYFKKIKIDSDGKE